MPRQRSWRHLWPGLALAMAIGVAVAWVMLYARVGAVRGDTYHLYSATNEARGVLKGTEVWLAGQKVGTVTDIAFRGVGTDTSARLVLELEILERYQPLIRRDSHAQIRSGGTLLGQPVVYIAVGSSATLALDAGDTLVTLPQGDTETLAAEVARLGRMFPSIARNAKAIEQRLMTVSGIARLDDEERSIELDVLRQRAQRLSRAAQGEGTIGRALRAGGGSMGTSIRSTMARADSLTTLLASERTSFGRFRRDTTLVHEIGELRDEVARVRALASSPNGTFGRAQADSAIRLELRELERQLDELIADIKRRPLRYVHF